MQFGVAQQVDVRTLMFASAIVTLLLALCLGFGLRRHRERIGPVITLWVAATAAQPVGWLLLSQRGVWPDWLSAVCGNAVMLGAWATYTVALRRFAGHRGSPFVPYGLAVLGLSVMVMFTYVVPSVAARIMSVSPISATIFALGAWALLRGAPRPLSASYTMTIGTLAVGSVLMLSRAVFQALFDPPISTLLAATPLQIGVFVYAALMPVLVSFGFLLMCNDRSQADLERQAAVDPLTGVFNRRALEELVNARLTDLPRYARPLSLLLLDADHFKAINDQHGHAAGDQALRALVDAVRPHLRSQDLLGRLGGEEFLVALGGTPASEALMIAERLRCAVATGPLELEDGARLSFSVSIGIASQSERESDDFASLVRRADTAMYAAKHAGRNCVRLAEWTAVPPTPTAVQSTSVH